MRPVTEIQRVWAIEPLEPRLVLTADSLSQLVGDAQFAYYDSQPYGTVESVFERDASTYDSNGVLQDPDTRRFADPVVYAPPIEWSGTGITHASNSLVRVMAAGWDHDGSTPLAVVRVDGSHLDLYRGDDLTRVGTITFDQLSQAAGEGRRLRPQGVVIFNGLVVIASERSEDLGNGYRVVGTTFTTTQDYGQTLDSVAQVGGGTDVPPLADGVANGISRGRTWAFLNAFPDSELDEPNQAWFPWADYLDKTGFTAGGQIGLFKATRAAVGEPWTVGPNRLIFERWEPNDPTGGTHAHTAAITTAGLVSHWGDVGYSNEIMLHEIDLDEYTTAPVTTTSVFGGYDENGTIYRNAPQPVAAAPAPTAGEHFASGDLTREMVLRFGDLNNGSESLEVEGLVDRPLSTTRGVVYEGAIILHLHWTQGVGYVSSSGIPKGHGHFSPDGEDWVAFNHATDADGRVLLYGDRLLGIAGQNELHLAPLPSIEIVEPLALAPGGTNLIAPSLQNHVEPAEGLALRQVEFVDGLWRYSDDGEVLDVQPEAPPFPPNTPVYEATSDSLTATSLGSWWLQEDGATADLSQSLQLEHWVANLSDQSVQLQTYLHAPGRGGGFSPIRAHESATTKDWVALDYRGLIPGDGPERVAAQLNLTNPAPGSRFLVAWPYLGEAYNLPYPLASGTSGPDESEVFESFEPTEQWTAAFVAAWPENASLNGKPSRTLLTLDGLDGDRVEIAVEYSGTGGSDRLIVSAFDSEVLVAENIHTIRLLRNETIEVAVSGDGAELRSLARSGSQQMNERVTPYGTGLAITNVQWGGSNWQSAAFEPIVLSFDPHAAASTEKQLDWMGSTLRLKTVAFARNAPGDYNGDGLVDAADYTVWRDLIATAPEVGDSADGDRDGLITESDADLWRQAYGTVVLTADDATGDYNGDGLVDAADYTVWRDQLASVPEVGDSADGNRDGRITKADYDVWSEAFGTFVPTLAEVLATPLSQSDTASLTQQSDNLALNIPPSSTLGSDQQAGVQALPKSSGGSEVPAAFEATADRSARVRATYAGPIRQSLPIANESLRGKTLLIESVGNDPRETAFADLIGVEDESTRLIEEEHDSDRGTNQPIGWETLAAGVTDWQ